MLPKSPTTVMPVLDGPVAGVTITVRSELSPGSTEFGLAEPFPERTPATAQAFPTELLRGIGPRRSKSSELLLVFVQPLSFLTAAVVLLRTFVGDVSEQSAAPYPTKSTIPFVVKSGQWPLKTMVLFTKATFPCCDPTSTPPVISGVGRLVVPPAPCDS